MGGDSERDGQARWGCQLGLGPSTPAPHRAPGPPAGWKFPQLQNKQTNRQTDGQPGPRLLSDFWAC